MEEDAANMNSEGGQLPQNTVGLNEYKTGKVGQLRQYQVEIKSFDPDNAERLFQECRGRIAMCQNIDEVDTVVQAYYSEVIKGEFNRNEEK